MTKSSQISLALVMMLIVAGLALLKPWRWMGSPKVALAELNDIRQLQTAFNQDKGKIRLILLLSPT